MMHSNYAIIVLPTTLTILMTFLVLGTTLILNASSVSYSNDPKTFDITLSSNYVLRGFSNPDPRPLSNVQLEETRGSYTFVANTSSSAIVKCQGVIPCIKGQVVKVLDGKSFYVSINNKIYKVDLALIALPVANQQAMIAATTFTRNTCLGSTVLIDQDDGQKGNSIIGVVYCSPTKSLNAMLLDTGYVQLERTQCLVSEFSKLAWASSHGC